MQLIRIVLAMAVLAALGHPNAAGAQQQKQPPDKQRPPVIINDRSIYYPPPPPHERTYVGPGPTVVPPMERIQPPAPLTPSPRP